MVFVNSMSDLFHKEISAEYIRKVFDVMVQARWHAFQVLTKRSHRLLSLRVSFLGRRTSGSELVSSQPGTTIA